MPGYCEGAGAVIMMLRSPPKINLQCCISATVLRWPFERLGGRADALALPRRPERRHGVVEAIANADLTRPPD